MVSKSKLLVEIWLFQCIWLVMISADLANLYKKQSNWPSLICYESEPSVVHNNVWDFFIKKYFPGN